MQKRIESWRALQFDPGLPLRRFKNAGNNVGKPVIMRDFKPLQRARDQPRQGPAARKNYAKPRAFLICQITNALSRDRFGLFGKVYANQKIETLCRFRAAAHFNFAAKYKIAFFQQLVKTLNHWRKRRQPEFFEFPTGSFEAIQRAQ